MEANVTFLNGRVRLIEADCRDVFHGVGMVDAVITSPPYNLGTTSVGGFPASKTGHYAPNAGMQARGGQGKWRRASDANGLAHGYGLHNDAMPHADYVAWQQEIISLCWDRLSANGAIFYNHKPRVLDGLLVTPFAYLPDLPVRQVVIWARAGGINFSPSFYCPTHEWVVVIAKPDFRLRDKAASGAGDVWYIPQEANTGHPAPFPLALPTRIIETVTSETILDPFMGSGTTGVAAVRLGRRFVGIEREPRWFDMACQRIEVATQQADLFIPTVPPSQEVLSL